LRRIDADGEKDRYITMDEDEESDMEGKYTTMDEDRESDMEDKYTTRDEDEGSDMEDEYIVNSIEVPLDDGGYELCAHAQYPVRQRYHHRRRRGVAHEGQIQRHGRERELRGRIDRRSRSISGGALNWRRIVGRKRHLD